MRVLITGGAGFIGSNLVEYFNSHSPEIKLTVVDDLSTGKLSNLENLETDFLKLDISDSPELDCIVNEVDAIVHLGALGSVPRSVDNPRRSHDVNVNGTVNLLEAARKKNVHVVFASSSAVYGANRKLPKNEKDWTAPISPYGVTKLAGEAYVLAYQKTYNLPALAFRFFNVYGPKQPADHDYAAVIPRFLSAALDGEPLTVHGDGLQSRDFTYVDSVCQTIHNAVVNKVVSESPVNLAWGTNTTLLDLIQLIREETGMELQIEHTDQRAGDVRASQADGLLLRELFPETATTTLRSGIRHTLEWFQSSTSD